MIEYPSGAGGLKPRDRPDKANECGNAAIMPLWPSGFPCVHT